MIGRALSSDRDVAAAWNWELCFTQQEEGRRQANFGGGSLQGKGLKLQDPNLEEEAMVCSGSCGQYPSHTLSTSVLNLCMDIQYTIQYTTHYTTLQTRTTLANCFLVERCYLGE